MYFLHCGIFFYAAPRTDIVSMERVRTWIIWQHETGKTEMSTECKTDNRRTVMTMADRFLFAIENIIFVLCWQKQHYEFLLVLNFIKFEIIQNIFVPTGNPAPRGDWFSKICKILSEIFVPPGDLFLLLAIACLSDINWKHRKWFTQESNINIAHFGCRTRRNWNLNLTCWWYRFNSETSNSYLF